MIVDSHAHLQWTSFDKDRERVINRAKKADVKCIVNIGYDFEGSKKAIELAEKYEGLYATIGMHPHNASELDEKVWIA
jgi:TatD DNase family protein